MKRSIFAIIFAISILSCNAQNDEKVKLDDNKNNNTTLITEYSGDATERQVLNNSISNGRQNAITRAIEKVSPAVVGINVTEVRRVEYRDPFAMDPFWGRFFGRPNRRYREYEVQGLGSGFIVSPDGYILTNHHVAGNASEVIVTMTNGKKYNAKIIGSDMVTDVALLKIDAEEDLPYLELSDSDNLIIGEWAIAFGNPFGLFDINAKPTVTVGVVSNNNVNFLHEDQPYNRVYRGMIQTDAAISSGNSGGPLVNSEGHVIGMNTVIFSTAQNRQGAGSIGIGFSIPINRVKKMMDLLKNNKEINRNFYTGMEVREIDDKLARYLKLKDKEGVIVFGFAGNSPANEAGFKLGDVIREIDGMKILKEEDYYIAVGDAVVGMELDFTLSRDGELIHRKLKLKSAGR